MSKQVTEYEQLAFNFNEEYPSLLEPLQTKEKELGASSPELIPLKIKLINFYFNKGDINNVHEYLKSVIELIGLSKDDSHSCSSNLEQLSAPAAVVDKNIQGAGMVSRLDEIKSLKTRNKGIRKAGEIDPIVISIKIEQEKVNKNNDLNCF
ncbi:MAG: hypothetical protein VYC17_03745 [Nitrospinota bacterium]|nr:hypothetical protein [Nitrospinota bacterium]